MLTWVLFFVLLVGAGVAGAIAGSKLAKVQAGSRRRAGG
jgi:hypothetical protein